MRDDILDFAARHTGVDRDQCRLDNDAVVCGNRRILLTELHAAGAKVNHRFTVSRRAYLSPRTIAFNVQGVRLAVHRDHRRDPHPAQRACRRHRPADQSDAVPRPARWRRRHGLRLGADREHGP